MNSNETAKASKVSLGKSIEASNDTSRAIQGYVATVANSIERSVTLPPQDFTSMDRGWYKEFQKLRGNFDSMI
jgi:hypothetical protein